ncbi:MAG: PorV/PorQ family protein [Candidatus Zixiibacteriota bacterium]|nr:MAG: PorV/PorQ family protein [candidate division Zixibacteria bacterium]
MIRRILIATILLAMLASLGATECQAEDGSAGTRSAQFLKLGLGGRAVAMGGAFVGLADDATAIYWNPAGLAGLKDTELSFMHRAWLQDISHEYFALVQPIGNRGVVAFSLSYLHMDRLQGRDQQGEPTSDFTASDMAITLAFGRKMTNSLLVGGSIKSIDERIEDRNAYGLAFDLGCLYQTPVENLLLGGVVQNWGRDITFVEESFRLPTVFKLGASYRRMLAGNPVSLAADVYSPTDSKGRLHSGAEYVYKNSIAGRIGYKNGSDLGDTAGLSLGLGLMTTKNQTYRIDYAFVPQGGLGNSHTFSLSISF